jgi:H+/gluconate symporter-like permease
MTIESFVTLVIIAVISAVIFMTLAPLPGKISRARKHPQADAINILGWSGLILGILPWLAALIWAHAKPLSVAATHVATVKIDEQSEDSESENR